jgi:ubiquinone/menaquinone biosynthesis C-methylase UbiE
MNSQHSAANLQTYNAAEVATHYAALDYISPCERLLIDTYIKPGMAILDLGVGGGRTTPYLSSRASLYVGADYSEEMIRVCQEKFPQLKFFVADASDLSIFPDDSFDAVVIAFNGMDYVLPEERRRQCLKECRRVLRVGGVLLFSSHNPRSILVRPAWDPERVRAFARKLVGEQGALFRAAVCGLTVAKAVQAFVRAIAASLVRILRRATWLAFWRGEGYFFDSSHGGLTTHCWVPKRVLAELNQFGFQFVTLLGDDYPAASWTFVTDWYYYLFSKANGPAGGESCT